MATASKLSKAEQTYIRELERQSLMSLGIKKEGDVIIIPSWAEIKDVEEALHKAAASLEDDTMIKVEFKCHPHDGLHAFVKAQTETFGRIASLSSSFEFFGMEFKIPGRSMSIPISFGETMNVPVGESQVMGLPIEMDVHPEYNEDDPLGGQLTVIFKCKRKFESLVRSIEEATRAYLKAHPLYKGQAINSRWEFMDVKTFDASKIVYTKSEELDIKSSILLPITHEEQWKKLGNYQRRGIVLAGDYGTGKTLTARYVAQVAVDNGWTFVNVLPGDDIVKSLNFARQYEPSVVFVEDIDAETKGERTARINAILNTVDGVVSKDSKIMLVLTTNHPDDIQPGMLRPGRVDNLITLGKLDEETMIRMVTRLAQAEDGTSLLKDKLNGKKLMTAATIMMDDKPKTMTPAFVSEAVSRAKAYAMVRGEMEGFITSEDVEFALKGIQAQFELVSSERKEKVPTLEQGMINAFQKAQTEDNEEVVETIKTAMDEVLKKYVSR